MLRFRQHLTESSVPPIVASLVNIQAKFLDNRPFNVWRWFLDVGKIYKPELKYIGLPSKNCYGNSEVMISTGSKYIEGFIITHGIPLQHAWNLDKGKAIDCTLSTTQQENPNLADYSDTIYFGVILPIKLVRFAFRHKRYSISGGSVLTTIAMMNDYDMMKAKEMLRIK